jgi:thiosulfate reductase cytochrome b subunit
MREIIVMIMSGLEIHNAYPTLPFKVPRALTLGGWLGGATQWHFAAMWVLVTSGLIYVIPAYQPICPPCSMALFLLCSLRWMRGA